MIIRGRDCAAPGGYDRSMNTATAVTSTPIPRAQYVKEVGLMSAGHGLTHWYPATFYLLLPLIGKELGLTYTQIGFILTTQHIVGAIANLPGGAIVDAYEIGRAHV